MDAQMIRTSVCSTVRMDAPLGCFRNLLLYDSQFRLVGGVPGVLARPRCCWRPGPPYYCARMRDAEPSVARSKYSTSHGRQCLFKALIERSIGIDDSLSVRDGFEDAFHLEIERKIPIMRGMRSIGLKVKTLARGFI